MSAPVGSRTNLPKPACRSFPSASRRRRSRSPAAALHYGQWPCRWSWALP